jgi:hypothetical protein
MVEGVRIDDLKHPLELGRTDQLGPSTSSTHT